MLVCRTQSHSDQIALGGLEKKTIFQGIDKGHFSSALPETMEAVLAHIGCGVRACRGLHCNQSLTPHLDSESRFCPLVCRVSVVFLMQAVCNTAPNVLLARRRFVGDPEHEAYQSRSAQFATGASTAAR